MNYRILCTSFLLIASLVNTQVFAYKAAGILPFAYDENDRLCFLLGLSSVHGDKASDFGGLRDASDNNKPYLTAAREACEELMFILDADESFKQIRKSRNRFGWKFDIEKTDSNSFKYFLQASSCQCIVNSTSDYCMYLMPIKYSTSLPSQFAKRKRDYGHKVPHCWNETTRLVWVPVENVYKAIDNRTSTKRRVTIQDFELYEPFVHSLLIARSLGVLPSF
jgi:hypothetical protein